MAKRAKWFENTVAKNLIEKSMDSGRSNGLIRGSSIGSKCHRKIAYMLLGYQGYYRSGHSAYVLNFGNAFHDMVQGWMADMGFVNATPYLDANHSMQWKGDAEGTILDVEDGVIGHYDGLTQPLSDEGLFCALNPEGKRYLLEFKTISNKSRVQVVYLEQAGKNLCTVKYTLPSNKTLHDPLPRLNGSPPKDLYSKGNEKYAAMVSENNLQVDTLLDVIHKPGAFTELEKPKPEHIDQATYYASRLKADAILLVYLAKDFEESAYEDDSLLNIPIKAFEEEVNPATVDALSTKAKKIWEHLEIGKARGGNPESWLPPRQYHPDDIFSECTFCDYRYTCYKEHEATAEQLSRRLVEAKALQLPIINGQPFMNHGEHSWGREAAKKGHVQDQHGQQAQTMSKGKSRAKKVVREKKES